MTKKLLKDGLGWGFLLWLVGYVLGILLFAAVPTSFIGWVITPIGVALTVYVLLRKVTSKQIKYYFLLSITWTIIAILCDYFFLVQIFKPANGYYKLDVYLYYTLTFVLPLLVGWSKTRVHVKN